MKLSSQIHSCYADTQTSCALRRQNTRKGPGAREERAMLN
jgi:hypothetical protein